MTLTVPFHSEYPLNPKHFGSKYGLSGVYALVRDGVCVYIGISGNVWSRWVQHRSQLRSGRHASAALGQLFKREEEHLWSFRFLIEEGHSTSTLNEKALIQVLRPIGNKGIYRIYGRDPEGRLERARLIAQQEFPDPVAP